MRRLWVLLGIMSVTLVSATASAHFPFLHLKSEAERVSTLHVYFSESAEPDDPALLDRLLGAKAWEHPAEREAQPLALKKGDVSLTAAISASKPAVYGFAKDYGVLSRGSSPPFLLMYYAKTYSGQPAWTMETKKSLALDIVPDRDGDRLMLTVFWKGTPLPDSEIVVQGGIDFVEGKTDEQGRFSCPLPSDGLFSIRAKHVEARSGEHQGTHFHDVRHYATLTLDFQ